MRFNMGYLLLFVVLWSLDVHGRGLKVGDPKLQNVGRYKGHRTSAMNHYTKPNGYRISDQLENALDASRTTSGIIAPTRKITGNMDGKIVNEKESIKDESELNQSLQARQRKGTLESHLSYKGVLAHKHPEQTPGWGNYPKDFGFRDYIRSGSVKPVEIPLGVVVEVQNRSGEAEVKIPRRHVENVKQYLIGTLKNATRFSLGRGMSNTSRPRLIEFKKSDIEKASWEHFLFSLAKNTNKLVANGSRLITKNMRVADDMEVAASMDHFIVVPADNNTDAHNVTDSDGKGNNTTQSNFSEAVVKQETNITNNVISTAIPNPANTSDFKDWLTKIYRGTVIDASRPSARHRANVSTDHIIEEGGLNSQQAAATNTSNSTSSSEIVVSKAKAEESAASTYVANVVKAPYPVYSTTHKSYSNEWLPHIYRGTIIDVTKHSNLEPNKEDNNKRRGSENSHEAGTGTITTDTKINKGDNKTMSDKGNFTTEINVNKSPCPTLANDNTQIGTPMGFKNVHSKGESPSEDYKPEFTSYLDLRNEKMERNTFAAVPGNSMQEFISFPNGHKPTINSTEGVTGMIFTSAIDGTTPNFPASMHFSNFETKFGIDKWNLSTAFDDIKPDFVRNMNASDTANGMDAINLESVIHDNMAESASSMNFSQLNTTKAIDTNVTTTDDHHMPLMPEHESGNFKMQEESKVMNFTTASDNYKPDNINSTDFNNS